VTGSDFLQWVNKYPLTDEDPDFLFVINSLEPAGTLNWDLVFEGAVGTRYIILADDVYLWFFNGI
jgi:hypothetical protein